MDGVCELGETLRKAREAKGLSLEEAARKTGVRLEYLKALEDCRFEALPEPGLMRAHLRRLARFLDLEPEALAALYPGGERPAARPAPPAPETRPPKKRRAGLWPFLLLALLLLGLAALLLWPRETPQKSEAPPPPPPAAPAPAAEAPKEPPPPKRVRLRVETEPKEAKVYLDGYYLGPAPVELEVEAGRRLLRVEAEGYLPHEQALDLTEDQRLSVRLAKKPEEKPKEETPPPPPPPKTLTLKVTQKSWIRVTTPDGKKLYEKTAPAGTELTFKPPVVVRVGNAGGVRAILGGRDLGPLGKPGEVKTLTFEAPKENE